MDGGKFQIPDEAMSEFYAAYGMDLYHGRRLFMIERNSHIFALHFDVDFSCLMDEERIQAFCDVLHSTVSEYFETPKRCIVCAVLGEDGLRKEPGLHVIFPTAAVDSEMAMSIWTGVVARCEQKLPWGADTWEKVIDHSVLGKNGSLRMVGSAKCKPCPRCGGGSGKKFCADCSEQGIIASDKVYWPWKVLPCGEASRQELAELSANKAHAVRVCSIRTSLRLPSKDFRIPEGSPLTARLLKTGGVKRFASERLPRGFAHAEQLAPSQDTMRGLLEAIHAYDTHYKELVITDTKQAGDRIFIKVRGFGETYCLNKGEQHTSGHVWFCLSTEGLSQRCFSNKPVQRQGGCLCSQFKGPVKPVDKSVMNSLLGTKNESLPEDLIRHVSKRPKRERGSTEDSFLTFGGFLHMTPDPLDI